MSAKHTPGPWELQKPLFGEQHIYVYSENSVNGKVLSGRQHICVVPYEGKRGALAYHKMFNANARLIAAAPELLEALQSVHQWMDDQADAQSKSGRATFDLMMLREQRDIVRAAIAKATGATT